MNELKYPYTMSDVVEAASEKRFTVISTFSGGGGSSIGYKLAGGDVLLANEFVEVAAETYKLNFPDTPILVEDIKKLTGDDFLTLAGIAKYELDILDGSPPCSKFSSAGNKEKSWNKTSKYSSNQVIENAEDLFLELVRIAKDIQPKIIIAENVLGIQYGESRKKLNTFINAFQNIGYEVTFKTIDACDFGVPQTRARTIIVCVRNDIFEKSGLFFISNVFPTSKHVYRTINDAFVDLHQSEEELTRARAICKTDSAVDRVMKSFPKENTSKRLFDITYADKALTKNHTAFFSMRKTSYNLPSPCLTATCTLSGPIHPGENRKFSLRESYRIMALPDDYKNTGTYLEQLERVGRMHSPFPLAYVADHVIKTVLNK